MFLFFSPSSFLSRPAREIRIYRPALTKRVGPFREESPSKRLKETDSSMGMIMTGSTGGQSSPSADQLSCSSDGEPKVDILKWTVRLKTISFDYEIFYCYSYHQILSIVVFNRFVFFKIILFKLFSDFEEKLLIFLIF